MKIKKVTALPRKFNNNASDIINQFIESDMDIAEVTWEDDYASASSCAGAMHKKISHDEKFSDVVGVVRRQKKVFIYRIGAVEVSE